MDIELFALVGFVLAAYSIVANDVIQTLGTFMASNSQRSWQILWLYACSILAAVLFYGYFAFDGDIAFSRLNRIPYPETGIQWWHAVPPLVLLFLTRFGVPVSTTFLVLTLFAMTGGAATEGVLQKMLTKSALGYVVAVTAGGLLYLAISRSFERWIGDTRDESPASYWVVLQWLSTAYLWSQWLMQDLANIFVYLPRTTTVVDGATQVSFGWELLLLATFVMLVLHAYVFATRGGTIQRIVLRKTNTTDIRAATLIDFSYGVILMIFKEWNDIPMSTTWVFLGLLAGREIAISWAIGARSTGEAMRDVAGDLARAALGLVVSVALAFGLPWLATGSMPTF
ncbi:MAG: hypothetical protein AAF515_09575 [Pseudomonadota bacterium]